MKTWNKRILLGVLCVLLTVAAMLLLSCGDGQEEDLGPLLTLLTEDGAPAYQVIRPDIADNTVTVAAVDVARALKESIGVEEVTIGSDWISRDGKADFPEIETEILVGLTNRAESEQVLQTLKAGEFAVRVVNKKVVVIGSNDFGTRLAAAYLIENYLSGERAGKVPEALDYKGEYSQMYTFAIGGSGEEKYDTGLAAVTLQGLFNRYSDTKIYVTTKDVESTTTVLDIMSQEGRWLQNVDRVAIKNLKALIELGAPYITTVVLWDVKVPATVNVATMIAGVEDGIVMTPEMYQTYKSVLPESINVVSLVDKFDGSETGSAKNDAYRWAIREYLEKGLCSTHYMCSYEDAARARANGELRYILPRDLAVEHEAFVFDLSPWTDEVPKDDMGQRKGLDRETYLMILEAQKKVRGSDTLTEISGFFPSWKYSDSGNDLDFTSKYKGTQVEWEFAYLFTPYGCYWNPVAENASNVTFHEAYPLQTPLVQNRPDDIKLDNDEKNVYMLIVMGDYDSTGSLYTKMIKNWNAGGRGKIPLAWSYNPNMLQQYPDIIEYFYQTATENDYFVSNVGGAGWYNPSRVPEADWPVVAAHHKKYFTMSDISVAPDIWDFCALSELSEYYVTQFATTGAGTLVSNQLGHGTGVKTVPHIADNGAVIDEISNRFDRSSPEECARVWAIDIAARDRIGCATFMSCRCVWSTPDYLISCIKALEDKLPDRNIIVLDPFSYYRLLGESME